MALVIQKTVSIDQTNIIDPLLHLDSPLSDVVGSEDALYWVVSI